MQPIFSKNKIIKKAISPYDNYCVGYSGKGGYLTALVMAIESFEKKFSHPGSTNLDSIISYDKAETNESYLGQINMQIVSSFCGPEGLIWGYDIAKKEDEEDFLILPRREIKRYQNQGIKISNGINLRKAAKELFGTKDERHFPFLPGAHVPCAGKFYFKEGPINLYGAIAIGIPQDRNKNACVLMEDVGYLTNNLLKEKIIKDAIASVIEIGRNQNVSYQEIFVDFISRQINSQEIGCALVVMPYFHLARKAFNRHLLTDNLENWKMRSKKYFLSYQK
jgi:histidine decarboxylase